MRTKFKPEDYKRLKYAMKCNTQEKFMIFIDFCIENKLFTADKVDGVSWGLWQEETCVWFNDGEITGSDVPEDMKVLNFDDFDWTEDFSCYSKSELVYANLELNNMTNEYQYYMQDKDGESSIKSVTEFKTEDYLKIDDLDLEEYEAVTLVFDKDTLRELRELAKNIRLDGSDTEIPFEDVLEMFLIKDFMRIQDLIKQHELNKKKDD